MDFSKVLNLKNILFGAGIFAIVIAMLGFSGRLPGFDSSSDTVEYTGIVRIWGTLPSENVYSVLDIFNKNVAKTYTVTYKEFTEENISAALITALADGDAPDLVLSPYTTALKNSSRIQAISNSTISETDYRNIFADQSQILIAPSGYLGLPISIDPLVMYYNRDLLSSSGIANPPETWDQFFDYSSKITKLNSDKSVKVSTIAFGTYDNIPHITEIVAAMIMQLGQGEPVKKTFGVGLQGEPIAKYKVLMNTDPANSESSAGPLNTVLAFMKNFSDTQKQTYNWNNFKQNALTEFISGNLAFYIGYASELGYIKSSNQKLYFDYTYLPQVANTNISATYGNMYTLFLLRNSQNPAAAYNTMLSLATGPYSANLSASTGGVSALKSVLAAPSGDQASVIFGRSGLFAKGFQNLYPNEMESLMKYTIDNVNSGSVSTVDAAKAFSENLQQVYGTQ